MVAQGRKELGQVIDESEESMEVVHPRKSQLSLDQTLKSHNWNTLTNGPVVKRAPISNKVIDS